LTQPAQLDETDNSLVALVTAGASGIGLEIARTLLEGGYRVHICDVDQAAVERFAVEHDLASGSCCDVSRTSQVERMFEDFKQSHGKLNVLVNNAGISGPTARVEDIEPDDWNRTIAVGLNGAFYVSRLAVPLLKAAGGGSIINIASSAALFGFPLRSPYAAAKWALIGFTKTLAMELGPSGIRVNAICPGSVSGSRIDAVISRDAKARGKSEQEIRDTWTRQTSLRCFVEPQDIAAMAAFLVSPAGARISGQALGVDGHTESLSSPLD
jgi:NAD(P)-dependent dehydrogenase (short-subunit alcohol dehydrogenase family)